MLLVLICKFSTLRVASLSEHAGLSLTCFEMPKIGSFTVCLTTKNITNDKESKHVVICLAYLFQITKNHLRTRQLQVTLYHLFNILSLAFEIS